MDVRLKPVLYIVQSKICIFINFAIIMDNAILKQEYVNVMTVIKDKAVSMKFRVNLIKISKQT